MRSSWREACVSMLSLIGAFFLKSLHHAALQGAYALLASLTQGNVIPLSSRSPTNLWQCHGRETLQFLGQMLAERLMVVARIMDGAKLSTSASLGEDKEILPENALIGVYDKYRSPKSVESECESMSEQSAYSWNLVISHHARNGKGRKVMQFFKRLLLEGFLPDKVTYLIVLSACASQAALTEGKQLHSFIMGSVLESDVMLGNALISMYGKCGSLQSARRTFNNMKEQNVVSWNSMISVHARKDQGKDGLLFFYQMKHQGIIADQVTFITILDACASQGALGEGMRIHACIIACKFKLDVIVCTALVNMYGKCGNLENAHRKFDEIHERNTISWNAIVAAYSKHGQGKMAFPLFNQMQEEGIMPNAITFLGIICACANPTDLVEGKRMHVRVIGSRFDSGVNLGNALVAMYRKCGSLVDAENAFEQMSEHDLVSWNAMVATYAQFKQVNDVFELFHQMRLEGTMPNGSTFTRILSVCANKATLAEGMRIHAIMKCNGFHSDLGIGNALVHMYGKCGRLDNAQKMFDEMPERDTVSWNAILAAYAQHGEGEKVLQLFDCMQSNKIVPDKISFVSVLSACSHAGLVDEACGFFASMTQDYGLMPIPDHFNCIIDLLARAGRLDEAEDLVNKMPVQKCAVSMRTLLGACRYQTDIERGERAAELVFVLDPKNTSPYTILTSLYAATDGARSKVELMS